MADIKVGDKVRVVSEFLADAGPHAGKAGTVTRVDSTDTVYPYLVRLDGDSYDEWFHAVELLNSLTSNENRSAFVTRAKELLTGTPHSVDDIIRMARFLAGD